MPKVRIGRMQLAAILANLVFGKAIGYSSEIAAREVSNDAWLAMLFAFLQGFIVIAIVAWLASRFGEERPDQYLPRLLGRPLGAIALWLLGLFLFVSFITSAITIVQHLNDYLMTETPFLIFVVLYTLLCIYGAYLGIEVAARLAIPGLLFTFILTALVVAGAVDHFDSTRLLPLLDHGLGPTLLASTTADTDVGMAVAGAMLLLPLTGRPQRWVRLSWWGLGLGALLTLVWPVFEVAVLGSEVTAQYLIACMQLCRAAELSIYLHRYEMVMVVFFVFGVITQSVVCLYGACEVAAAVMPKRLRRPWVYVGAGLLAMPIEYYLGFDRDRYAAFLAVVWPPIAIAIAFGLPLLLAGVALLRPGLTKTGAAAP